MKSLRFEDRIIDFSYCFCEQKFNRFEIIKMPILEPIQQIADQAPVFFLVLFRVAGLLVLTPMMGSSVIPVKFRALLALALSAVIFPMVPTVVFEPNSFVGLAIAVGTEMLIGITMGFALSLLMLGVQVGAEMVGHQMGFAMARLVDPNTRVDTTVLSQFYVMLATLIYILMNGHLVMIKSLVNTFYTVPLLGASISTNVLDTLVAILSEAFMLGVRIAGPALVAIYLATLALGFISRTMPQLNILAAGFPIRITLAFTLLIASLGSVFMLFQDKLTAVLETIGLLFV